MTGLFKPSELNLMETRRELISILGEGDFETEAMAEGNKKINGTSVKKIHL